MQSLMANIWNLNIIRSSAPLLLFFLAIPQEVNYLLLQSLPVKATFITSDHFNNLYVISDRNVLQKYALNKPISIWSENKWGRLERIDASNPLKLLLFYPDHSTIVLLNNDLGKIGTYQLHYKGFTDVGAVGLAQDNNIWIYDLSAHKLKKIDENATTLVESENLNALGFDLNPNFIMHKNNQVYLNDPVEGILVFDNFGTYYKTIPIEGLKDFQLIDDQLVYFYKGILKIFHEKTLEMKEMPLPIVPEIEAVSIQKDRLFIRSASGVYIFQY